MGRWGITVLPEGWVIVPNLGARQFSQDPRAIVSSIVLSHDPLPPGKTLLEYMTTQRTMIAASYPEAQIAGPQPSPFPNAEEGFLLLVRHRVPMGMDMLHVQNYVRVGTWIGIVTLTVAEPMLRTIRPDHDAFVKGLCILPPEPPAPPQQLQ